MPNLPEDRLPRLGMTMTMHSLFMMLLLAILFSCQPRDDKQNRALRASQAKGDILIGAAAPWQSDPAATSLYGKGLDLAVAEINSQGGVLGRRIVIERADDKASVQQGRIVAQHFANNRDMVAVIGHINSFVSIPASIMYEYYGILMLSPLSTAPELSRRAGARLIFRNIPTDEQIAFQLARFAIQKGYSRIPVYYVEDAYGRGLAKAFQANFEKLGGSVPDARSYDAQSDSRLFRTDLATWKKNFTFDALFVAGTLPRAGQVVAEARSAGITAPIIGGDGLGSAELGVIAGDRAEGTIVAGFFDPADPRPEVQHFGQIFMEKFGLPPDDKAAQTYDAVGVLAYAIKQAGSTIPSAIADALRATKDWPGVTGPHTFNENGDLAGKPIVIKTWRHNQFEVEKGDRFIFEKTKINLSPFSSP